MRGAKKRAYVQTFQELVHYRTSMLVWVFIALFAVVGPGYLLTTHAATSSASTEAEDGARTSGAVKTKDGKASNGFYVQFSDQTMKIAVVPGTIASDCSADVQPELSAWLSSQSSFTTVEFKKDGCYLVQDQLEILDRSHFVVHGNNALIKRTLNGGTQASVNHAHFHIARSDNVVIKDIRIQGSKLDTEGFNSGREAQHGFSIYGVTDSQFDNVWINQIWGDCFYFREGNGGPSARITVSNSYCNQTGRHGMGVVGATDLTVTGNTFQNNHRENFDFEPTGANGQFANNITIDKNTIGEASQLLVSASEGSPEFKNFTFTNNLVHRRFVMELNSASQGRMRGPVNISNNTSDKASHGGGMTIQGFDGGTIVNNNILFDGVNNVGDPTGVMLNLYTSRNFVIKNNTAQGGKAVLKVDQYTDGMCQLNNSPIITVLPGCSN